MTMPNAISALRALGLLLVIALATSGFAHRAVTPAQQAAEAYAQASGVDLADICGGEGEVASAKCPACRLQADMSFPEPQAILILLEPGLESADWTPRLPVLVHRTRGAVRPARAPPAVLT